MVEVSNKQLDKYAKSKFLMIKLKTPHTARQLFNKYKLFVAESKSDYEDEIFYNDDLRSRCGYVEDESTLEFEPRYYASIYPKEFKRLIENAKSVTISN